MEPQFFALPKSNIQGIPLYSGENNLQIGFIEVGCKPNKKRGKLKNTKQLFLKYWGDNYKQSVGDWIPTVYRALAHYDPTKKPGLDFRKWELDVVLDYQFISEEMLKSLDEQDKKQVFHIVRKEKQRHILEEILKENDAERLHALIVAGGDKPQVAYIRGQMAEILAQKDADNNLPPGMNLFRNGNIRYFNRRFRNGTEIDAVQTLYKEETYISWVEALRKLDHVTVRDKWHS
ncbi:hypothetical protein HOI26_04320 [Candidatus Woesearchaeota archaeon]|nr:hypothetical protein [Candidatus Woesearchaeota archaeon]MBT5740300.1 hypothetical protein [Candidatus Woesearchaeota archaeon]